MSECRWGHSGFCEEHETDASICRHAAGDLQAKVEKLQRYPFEPICLNCGALEPCMTEADLKPGDPGVPCTFDPTPRQLFEENANLRDRVRELKAALMDLQDHHCSGRCGEENHHKTMAKVNAALAASERVRVAGWR